MLVVAAYQRLADATQIAVSSLPASGTPRERLRRFVVAFYDTFDEQSPGAAAILGVTGVPEFDEQVNAVRAWRRKELTTILRAGEHDGSLQLPLKQAVAVAFLWTAYATWHSLSIESKLGPAATQDVARAACVGPDVVRSRPSLTTSPHDGAARPRRRGSRRGDATVGCCSRVS